MAAMLSLVCSCEDEKIQQPEFVLETPEISISAEGGNYEILYSIKNPSEDARYFPRPRANGYRNWMLL